MTRFARLPRRRRLMSPLFLSGLLGGTFLMMCDWLTALGPFWYNGVFDRDLRGAQLPIGVVTAIVGAPLFLIILRRSLR
ncbi:MAG: iron chelate uptake ABC transporter family permease subunit [Planctomycetes bacterium]|nr:iron chelate uptake ABC transporter family permease subunit [Planctomycetota bacterium]